MENYGKIIESGVLRFERLLPGPIEKVWEYLTDSEMRGTWLASGKMEMEKDGKVELNFQHENLSEEEDPVPEKYASMDQSHKMEGTITAFDPPRLLSYTWEEQSGIPSEVTFELAEQVDGVLLVLTHRKLGDDRSELIGVCAGWHSHLQFLRERLEGKKTKGFWQVHMPLEDIYEKRI